MLVLFKLLINQFKFELPHNFRLQELFKFINKFPFNFVLIILNFN